MANPKLDASQIVACFPGQIERKPGFPIFNLFTPLNPAPNNSSHERGRSNYDLLITWISSYVEEWSEISGNTCKLLHLSHLR
jgi:hypothetical protein